MAPAPCLIHAISNTATRRGFLKCMGAGATSCLFAVPAVSIAAGADALPHEGSSMNLGALIAALRATGKQTCLAEADRLAEALPLTSGFNLHLRRAGLSLNDALKISEAISPTKGNPSKQKPEQQASAMQSFSISDNPNVQDAGVVALAESLPATLREIGMVECRLGDESGEALLNFASQSSGLRMMCIEGNNFSAAMQQRLARLGAERTGLIVIV